MNRLYVGYNPEEYKRFNYVFKLMRERNQREEHRRKLIIERNLQQGVAVCEGYAVVFECIGELLRIPIYPVLGDIKTRFDDIGRPSETRHLWNIATIDGQKYLFNCNWVLQNIRIDLFQNRVMLLLQQIHHGSSIRAIQRLPGIPCWKSRSPDRCLSKCL